jgi:hypothetical protein
MSTGSTPSPAVTAPPASDFAQALNDLLPPLFAEVKAMSPDVRETLTESMWYHQTTELFHLITPAILGTKFLSEVIPVFAPIIRKLHALAVANGRMAASNALRLTWKMINYVPTQKTKTNMDKEAVAIHEDDAICWAAICAEVFQTSPSYVNKLTTEVPLLPPLPEETMPDEEKNEEEEESGSATTTQAEEGTRTDTDTNSSKKRTGKKKQKKPEPDAGKTVVLIPAPDLQKGDVETLYKFLDGNGANGLVPLDAVFGGLEEGKFQSKLSRFANAIAYAFFPNKLNVRVERVGEESKSPVHQLKEQVKELESDLAQARGQMQMMADQAAEHPEQTCAEFSEWLEAQR